MHHTFSVLDVCVFSGDRKILFASMSAWCKRTRKSVSSPTKIVFWFVRMQQLFALSTHQHPAWYCPTHLIFSSSLVIEPLFVFLICQELIFLGLNERITSEVHCSPWTCPCSYQMNSIFCWKFIGVSIKNRNISAISLFDMVNIHVTHIIIYGSLRPWLAME